MNFRALKYLAVYITPALVIFSILAKGWWSYTAMIVLFGFIPFIELFTSGTTKNLSEVEEEIIKKDRFYDYLIYALLPIHYTIMYLFLSNISTEGIPLYGKIGMTISFGLSCGIIGINVAHELGHRNSKFEQTMSKMLLLSTQYMHFFIEHNRGHHKNVSTDDDPASSRSGEIIYTFYVRSTFWSWISAWNLESKRLKSYGKSPISWMNEMVQFTFIQLSLILIIYSFFNLETTLWYLLGSVIGILLLETVNYIEHYGLRRKWVGNRYERTMPIHSWNSNHPIGRLMLFELSRHSDHHFISTRKYQLLRNHNESPQMPTGYPGMMMLTLIPPLWFRVMNPRVAKFMD